MFFDSILSFLGFGNPLHEDEQSANERRRKELQRQADTSTVASDDNASNDFLTGMAANAMLDETTNLAAHKTSHEDDPNTLESIWKGTDSDDVSPSNLQDSQSDSLLDNADSGWSDSSSDSSWNDGGWSDGGGFGDGGGCDGF